jgi:hypothetical protein
VALVLLFGGGGGYYYFSAAKLVPHHLLKRLFGRCFAMATRRDGLRRSSSRMPD